MTRRMLWACVLALLVGLPGVTRAGEVRVAFKDGRVDVVARDATLREILIEWERVGGTKIVNRDRVPGTRLTLDLKGVPEDQALTTLLRPIAGYMASRRLGPDGGSSAFSRIVLMTAAATPVSYPAGVPGPTAPASMGTQQGPGGPPLGRPGMQRRVLPDGRVVTVMDDPDRAAEPDDRDETQPPANQPGMMRPPFGAPPRQQGQGENEPPQPPSQSGQAVPTTTSMPMAPTVTVATPGALPATKPGATPAAPIKPPGE